jgi:hypothetical protein
MKYECVYNPELNIVEGVTHGMADVAKFIELMDRVMDLCGQEEAENILVDHSDLDAGSLTMEHIETLGRTAASKKDVCKVKRCAIVVTNDLQFGLARAWEIIVSMYDLTDLETRLFRNRDEAIQWIKAGT